MRETNEPRKGQFLRSTSGAGTALAFAILLLVVDLVPSHRTVNGMPLWMRMSLIPLFLVAVGIAIWRIRSLWESLFLSIFAADIALKGILPPTCQAYFRSTISPILWFVAAVIAASVLLMSRRKQNTSNPR